MDADLQGLIAGKPDSHRFLGDHNICERRKTLWELACQRL